MDITTRKLNWLQSLCSEPVPGLAMRLATLLVLGYVAQKKSKALFEQDGQMVAWPPQLLLAQRLGSARQAVAKAAAKLEELGFVEISVGQGRGHASEYRLIEKAYSRKPFTKSGIGNLQEKKRKPAGAEKASAGCAKGKPQLPHHHQSITNKQNQSHHHNEERDDFSLDYKMKVKVKKTGAHPEFEALFELWPNSDKDERKAFGAWVNAVLRKKGDPKFVLKRARSWIAYWRKEGEVFIPFLGIWLSRGGWRNEPPLAYEAALAKWDLQLNPADLADDENEIEEQDIEEDDEYEEDEDEDEQDDEDNDARRPRSRFSDWKQPA